MPRQTRLDAPGALRHVIGRGHRRILGSGQFVEKMVEEAETRMNEMLRGKKRLMDLRTLLKEVAKRDGWKKMR